MYLGINEQKREKIAVVDEKGRELSYGDICDFISDFGKKIVYRSVMFCLCDNEIGSLVGYLGCLSNKTVPLLISANIDRELLNNLMEVYKPAYIWLAKKNINEFSGEIIYESYEYALIRTSNEVYRINDDLALLLTTSGSTGSPKLVRHTYKNLESNAKNVAAFLGLTDEERGIIDLPMQYTMGLNTINSHLYAGACVLITTQNLMSAEFWKYIKEQKGTNFTGVPFSYELLFKLRFTRMELPYLKTFAQGGGKLVDAMFSDLVNYANETGRRFFATYGTTETSARLAYLPCEVASNKIGSIGKAIPGGEMFLIDSNGKEIEEVEAEGELGYRGPNVTMGYAFCCEDLMKGDEWSGEYLTGDIARRDSEGYYFIIGRKSRFLKLYGLRVSLDRCERLIKDEFNIDCACSGTDERMNIYITDDREKDNVLKFISNKTGIAISGYSVYVVDEILRNESGKIQYEALKNKINLDFTR